jgi:hypothetical protein
MLQESERVVDGGVVGAFDLRGDLRVGDRPQRRHRLDRREGQVKAGNRLGARTRRLGDGRGDLAGIDRITVMLRSEELPRHLGADPRPIRCGDWLVSQLSARGLLRGNPFRQLNPECADIAGVDLERRAQLGRCLDVCVGQVGSVQLRQPLGCERMHTGAEQKPHLLRRHHIPNV